MLVPKKSCSGPYQANPRPLAASPEVPVVVTVKRYLALCQEQGPGPDSRLCRDRIIEDRTGSELSMCSHKSIASEKTEGASSEGGFWLRTLGPQSHTCQGPSLQPPEHTLPLHSLRYSCEGSRIFPGNHEFLFLEPFPGRAA